MLIKDALRARRFFPHAPRPVAAKQAVAYAKAREYLRVRGIDAVAIGSKFKYVPCSGSVL